MTLLRDEYPEKYAFHQHLLPSRKVICPKCNKGIDEMLISGRVLDSFIFWNEEKQGYEKSVVKETDFEFLEYNCGSCLAELTTEVRDALEEGWVDK